MQRAPQKSLIWVATFGPAFTLLAVIKLASVMRHVDVGFFTRDTLAIANDVIVGRVYNPNIGYSLPMYSGFLSNIGALCWCATATTCFLTAALLHAKSAPKPYRGFFLWAGGITTMLLVDDLFMFHDLILLELVGIPEPVTTAFYGIPVLVFLVLYRRHFSKTNYAMLLTAFAAFAVSAGVDSEFLPSPHPDEWMFDDGPKFLGIAAWTSYWTQTCWYSLNLPPT